MKSLAYRSSLIVAAGGTLGGVLLLVYGHSLFGVALEGAADRSMVTLSAFATAIAYMVGHLLLVKRECRKISRFSNTLEEEVDPKEAEEIVRLILHIPQRLSFPIMLGMPLIAWAALWAVRNSGVDLPLYFTVCYMTAGALAGVMAWTLMHALFRRFGQQEISDILKACPTLMETHLTAKGRGINTSLFAAFFAVLSVPLLLVLMISWSRLWEFHIVENSRARFEELRNVAALVKEQAYFGGEEAVTDFLRQLEWRKKTRIELRDRKGGIVFANDVNLEIASGAAAIVAQPESLERLRPQLGCPARFDWMRGDDPLNAFNYFCGDDWHVVAFYELSDDLRLTLVSDIRDDLPPFGGYAKSLVWIGSIVSFLAVLIAFFSSNNITRPIGGLARILEAVSHGNLNARVNYFSENELGWLALTITRMKSGLSHMIGNIHSVVETLNASKNAVEQASAKILFLSQQQAQLLDESAAVVQQMTASLKGIAESVSELDKISSDGSLSIQEMNSSTQQTYLVSEDLSELSVTINQAIGEMAESTKKIDVNIANLFDLTEQTSSAMLEIDANLIEVKDNVNETENISKKLLVDANEGVQTVRATRKEIERIKEVGLETKSTIERLKDNAKRIGRILNVIDEIVDQTKLLSLNAAIIAAQAGEHGKGFAVVANEIKELAKKTAESTGEIANLIHLVQEHTYQAAEKVTNSTDTLDEGVRLSNQSEKALEKLLEGVTKTSEWVRMINASTQEQSRGSKDVTKSIETVVVMTDEIANATRVQDVKNEAIRSESERMKSIAQQVRGTTREQSQTSQMITKDMEKLTDLSKRINMAVSEQEKGAQRVLDAEVDMGNRAKEQLEISMGLKQVVEDLGGRSRELEKELRQFKL